MQQYLLERLLAMNLQSLPDIRVDFIIWFVVMG